MRDKDRQTMIFANDTVIYSESREKMEECLKKPQKGGLFSPLSQRIQD